jgi:hypothetical protein
VDLSELVRVGNSVGYQGKIIINLSLVSEKFCLIQLGPQELRDFA